MFVGLEKLSLVDYDNKVSCILFKQGCNFRCPFCHNSSLVTHLKENIEIPFEEILAYLRKRKGV
ncbi:MAG: 4Fe-4S cluster-binding domain-containing protein, partial [Erysipelotrichia bacterium]|nr:4Fe-4S cluster-binding domain-containing protein [Erysipelotrichia bacterium]